MTLGQSRTPTASAESRVLGAGPRSARITSSTLIGAASTPYALAPEFELSMSKDPFSKEMVEAHAHAVVELFFDDPGGSKEGAS